MLDGATSGVTLGSNQVRRDRWLMIAGFILFVWLGLLVLPRETVLWFLVAVAVAMVYNYFG